MTLGFATTYQFSQPSISEYRLARVENFQALESPEATRHPELLRETVQLLGFRLRQMKQELPRRAFGKLIGVRFWIEYQDPLTPAAVYHPDRKWLIDHGYNPEMAGSIEIGNMGNFLKWQFIQPSMVLHEMAHAYQFQFLGENYPRIESAYRHAVESHAYDAVPYVLGGRQRAYALTNKFEYFAECTEAFFGRNDFYPFLRSELKRFDPDGYAMVKGAWRSGSCRPASGLQRNSVHSFSDELQPIRGVRESDRSTLLSVRHRANL